MHFGYQKNSDKCGAGAQTLPSSLGTLTDSENPFRFYLSGVTVDQNVNTLQTTSQEKSQVNDDFSWTTTLPDAVATYTLLEYRR